MKEIAGLIAILSAIFLVAGSITGKITTGGIAGSILIGLASAGAHFGLKKDEEVDSYRNKK